MSALATALRRRSAHVMTLLLVTMLSGCWLQVGNKGDSGGTVRSTTVLDGKTEQVIICGAAANKCAGYLQVGLEQLVATPQPGYVFDGWSGACEGTASATCTVDVTRNSWISTRAYFNYAPVSIAAIADQSLLQNFAPFSLQAKASSSAGAVSYSVTNSRPDAVDVSIDPASGQLSLSPLTDQFGNAEIEVFAAVAGGQASSTRFAAQVAMPTNPVFACGTGVETETGDTMPGSYTLFEGGQMRPLAISPNGRYLFVTNTPANCLEIYNIEQDTPQLISSVAVGLEPVAVAARSDTEVWVVNHLSDSVSVVDIRHRPHVKRTLLVGDEPRDIVFGGAQHDKAFISAAFRGQNHPSFDIDDLFTPGIGRGDVWVFDSNNLGTSLGGDPLTIINVFSDTLGALAVTPDGSKVYAAGLLTGNQTTIIDQESARDNKPEPAANSDGATAPATGLIVKFDGNNWKDEDGTAWDSQINFSLPDQDVFAIDATLTVPALSQSFSHVGTTILGMAIQPTDGTLFVANTDARNQVRFEGPGSGASTVRGNIAKNRITLIDQSGVTPFELNTHINFDLPFGQQVTASAKRKSIAQPGAMAFVRNKLWVLGFGSGKIHVYRNPASSSFNQRFDKFFTLPVPGGGPAGIVMQDDRRRAYVYSRLGHSISVYSTQLNYRIHTHTLFTPEPAAIIAGRKFLYDTNLTSGNGTASCASCHIFADMDGLAWDLGNPDDEVKDDPNTFLLRAILSGNVRDPKFHPMKGPMTTQTLRGIDSHGPLHWRGDRTGQDPLPGDTLEETAFKEFNAAFVGLIGRDQELSDADMELFTQFAMQLTPPPNPIRNLDNSLTQNQQDGRDIYFNTRNITGLGGCNDCHRLDPAQKLFGSSTESTFEGEGISQFFKIPHTRNAYQKVGKFGTTIDRGVNETHSGPQIKGFGYLHDGSVDTLNNFFTERTFKFPSPKALNRRKVSEFVLVFDSNLKPVVGQQVTLTTANAAAAGPRIDLFIERSLAGDCDLIVWSSIAQFDAAVSARLQPNGSFKLSVGGQISDAGIRNQVSSTGEPVTYTCVPPGGGARLSGVL